MQSSFEEHDYLVVRLRTGWQTSLHIVLLLLGQAKTYLGDGFDAVFTGGILFRHSFLLLLRLMRFLSLVVLHMFLRWHLSEMYSRVTAFMVGDFLSRQRWHTIYTERGLVNLKAILLGQL